MSDPDPAPGRLRQTSAATLAVGALLGGLLGGLVPPLVERFGGIAPTVPWSSVFALVFWAAVLFGIAVTTGRTLHRRRERIDHQRAVNLLVLGKASALAGAVVAGGYAAFGLTFAGQTDVALPRERLVHGLVAAAAAAAVMVGGLMLERACRVPDADDHGKDSDAPDT